MKDAALLSRKPETLATSAYQRLRREIVVGEYPFGSKLKIKALCDRYQIGLSPMREALNRASNDGLVTVSDLKGFYVAPISEADLDDILRSRVLMNEAALRDSIAQGDAAWEEALVVAHHRLSRIPFSPMNVDPAWETAHRAFHAALLSGCKAPRLLAFCEQLFEAAQRYRCVARQMAPRADYAAGHKEILEATLARRADEAVALLTTHFTETAERCRAELRRVGK
jgi:DNA-binding GntR family transcriptional regulator